MHCDFFLPFLPSFYYYSIVWHTCVCQTIFVLALSVLCIFLCFTVLLFSLQEVWWIRLCTSFTGDHYTCRWLPVNDQFQPLPPRYQSIFNYIVSVQPQWGSCSGLVWPVQRSNKHCTSRFWSNTSRMSSWHSMVIIASALISAWKFSLHPDVVACPLLSIFMFHWVENVSSRSFVTETSDGMSRS